MGGLGETAARPKPADGNAEWSAVGASREKISGGAEETVNREEKKGTRLQGLRGDREGKGKVTAS